MTQPGQPLPPLTGLILAGGKSTRFGSDKAWALLEGRPMLQWVASALAAACSELVVVRADGQALPPIDVLVPVRTLVDRYVEKGPLAGLVTGFPAVDTEYCFAVSCDTPLLQPGFVRLLASAAPGHDVACARVDGHIQPLAAVYRPAACLQPFEDSVRQDLLRIVPLLAALDTVVIPEAEVLAADPGLLTFKNANRPEVLAELEALVRERGLA